MSKIIYIYSFLIFIYLPIFSQNIPQNPNKTDKKGLRQGKWTICLDDEFKPINNCKSATYYRLIQFKDDKPIGLVKEFYKNGQKYWTGKLLTYQPDYIIDGKAEFYNQAGLVNQLDYYEKGELNLDSTIALNQQLLKNFSSQSIDYQLIKQYLAELYEEKGAYQIALNLYQEVKEILAKKPAYQSPEYATVVDNVARMYYELGQYKLAEPLILEAKDIREQTLGKEDPAYTSSCNNLAQLFIKMGSFKPAEQLLLEAKAIREKTLGKQSLEYATSCHNLAGLYQDQGLYKQAEELYIEAKNIRERNLGKEDILYAFSCNNLGLLYYELGLFALAEPLYLEAKVIYEKVLGNTHPEYATSCNNLADLYNSQGLYEKAENLYLEAKQLIEESLGKNHPDYALQLNNLAVLYNTQGHYELAEPLLLEVKKIYSSVLGQNHPSYSLTCNNLARVYDNLGKSEVAEALYLESLRIDELNFGKYHPNYATTLNNLALLYFYRGQNDKAERLLLESKQIREKVWGRNHADYALICNHLGEFYDKLGNYSLAEQYYKEGAQFFLNETQSNFVNLSEKEKNAFFQTFNTYFEIYLSFVLRAHKKNPSLSAWVYNNSLIIKGLLFQSNEKMKSNILQSGDKNLIQLYQDWKTQKDYLLKVYQMSLLEKERQKIDENQLEITVNQLEKELSGKSTMFSQANQAQNFHWQDVQKKLKPGEAAVEIIRTRYYDSKWIDSTVYVALIIQADTKNQPEMAILPNGKAMEGEFFQNYRRLILSEGQVASRGDSLNNDFIDLDFESAKTESKVKQIDYYQVYWQAIADKLKKSKKIYLAPDGVYNQLSISALRNAKTGQYVLDEVEIQLLGSCKDLITKSLDKNISSNFKNAVLFGFPDYNGKQLLTNDKIENQELPSKLPDFKSQKSRFLKGQNISQLPGTKIEIENIEKILKQKSIDYQSFIFEKATETQVKKIQSPHILHLATHGFFLEDVSPDADNQEKIMGISSSKLIENPLIRAGLLFARAKNAFSYSLSPSGSIGVGSEDGVLTAYEAMNLNLEATDLVILSACETGLGKVQNGEGVYGLQRAFQQAGAKSIMMSLWAVSDEATQKLMTYFYQNLILKQLPKRQAFIQAQKQLRQDYPSPYFWAAFVMVGE